jgi:hypothetical protein
MSVNPKSTDWELYKPRFIHRQLMRLFFYHLRAIKHNEERRRVERYVS